MIFTFELRLVKLFEEAEDDLRSEAVDPAGYKGRMQIQGRHTCGLVLAVLGLGCACVSPREFGNTSESQVWWSRPIFLTLGKRIKNEIEASLES